VAASIVGRTVVAALTLLLLVSMGGAIFASPILLPLLFIAAVRSGRPGRAMFSFLGGLVAAEVAWAGVYVVSGEPDVVIWAGPLMAFLAVTVGYFWVTGLGIETSAGSWHALPCGGDPLR
jgi:hypothetical protein